MVPLVDRPILIVEDSDEDFEVTVWALRQAGAVNRVHRCAKSADIEDVLAGRPNWPAVLATRYPVLVLLDLNLPGADWLSNLTRFRNNRRWQPVPVVVVSTSQQPATVLACYSAGAAGYLKKSVDLDTFAEAIRDTARYWLHTVVPPPPCQDGVC